MTPSDVGFPILGIAQLCSDVECVLTVATEVAIVTDRPVLGAPHRMLKLASWRSEAAPGRNPRLPRAAKIVSLAGVLVFGYCHCRLIGADDVKTPWEITLLLYRTRALHHMRTHASHPHILLGGRVVV